MYDEDDFSSPDDENANCIACGYSYWTAYTACPRCSESDVVISTDQRIKQLADQAKEPSGKKKWKLYFRQRK